MSPAVDLPFDLAAKNAELERATPEQIIRFARDTWGEDLAMQSSFGADSACLLHLATSVMPQIRILFLQTHYHFPETLDFKRRLTERLGLNAVELEVLKGRDWFLREHGDDLHRRDKDFCCFLNKVEPMDHAKRELGIRAYLTGVRREQSAIRAQMKVLTVEPSGVVKVAPILNWTREQVRAHLKEHDLPYHPLVKEGYPSIGCWPCTAKPVDPTDERSGRWSGEQKTECGLHLPPSQDPVI